MHEMFDVIDTIEKGESSKAPWKHCLCYRLWPVEVEDWTFRTLHFPDASLINFALCTPWPGGFFSW